MSTSCKDQNDGLPIYLYENFMPQKNLKCPYLGNWHMSIKEKNSLGVGNIWRRGTIKHSDPKIGFRLSISLIFPYKNIMSNFG
jgi:hypothetical protein